MSDLTVQPVTTRRQRKQFLNLPWTLYRGDPNWVPPLRLDQEELVGYRHHPFYERNEIQTFLAFRGDEVCGRIAAILNRNHNDYHHEKRGFWGFFESVDDQEVANALFDAVRQWFAQRDILQLRGPMNPAFHYTLGLLTEGFDSPPTFLMTYNPSYYPRLAETYGFRKAQDLFAYYGHRDQLPASSAKVGPIADQIIQRYNVRLRPLDRKRFLKDVEEFVGICNRALPAHWSFVPLPDNEVKHLAKGLRWLLVPELAVGAEIDGRLVGVVLALPDYNPRIKRIDGRLFPFGFLRLIRNKQAIKKVRLAAAYVVPEYQLHGIGLVLLRALVPKGLEWGMEEVEYSWVAESNHLSRGALEKGGAKRIKTYRVYDLCGRSEL
jgi:GNAT superfamily N-acetyltransferase